MGHIRAHTGEMACAKNCKKLNFFSTFFRKSAQNRGNSYFLSKFHGKNRTLVGAHFGSIFRKLQKIELFFKNSTFFQNSVEIHMCKKLNFF